MWWPRSPPPRSASWRSWTEPVDADHARSHHAGPDGAIHHRGADHDAGAGRARQSHAGGHGAGRRRLDRAHQLFGVDLRRVPSHRCSARRTSRTRTRRGLRARSIGWRSPAAPAAWVRRSTRRSPTSATAPPPARWSSRRSWRCSPACSPSTRCGPGRRARPCGTSRPVARAVRGWPRPSTRRRSPPPRTATSRRPSDPTRSWPPRRSAHVRRRLRDHRRLGG